MDINTVLITIVGYLIVRLIAKIDGTLEDHEKRIRENENKLRKQTFKTVNNAT